MKSLKDFLIEASIEDIVKYIQDNNIDPDFALKAIEYRSAKKTYYVRVRTYKKVGSTYYYSGWSTYKTGKTK